MFLLLPSFKGASLLGSMVPALSRDGMMDAAEIVCLWVPRMCTTSPDAISRQQTENKPKGTLTRHLHRESAALSNEFAGCVWKITVLTFGNVYFVLVHRP